LAETLGSLFDKLTIVRLKLWHCEEKEKLRSLGEQQIQIIDEMNEYVGAVLQGKVAIDRLAFAANKVYAKENMKLEERGSSLAEKMSELATVNCALWHQQELVYDFANVPVDKKDKVIKLVAQLNLERNQYIEAIDLKFREIISKRVA